MSILHDRFHDLTGTISFHGQDVNLRCGIHRKREIGRAREIFRDAIICGNTYHTDPDSLDRYFMQFAFAARRER